MSLPEDFFAEPHKGRGRPKSQTLAEARRGAPGKIALEVFRAELRLGSTMTAARAVAAEWRLPVGTVKRYASRHREGLEWLARVDHIIMALLAECDRRMLAFPDDVRQGLRDVPMSKLLALLREHNIDGTCPKWLIDAVRSR
jgi:hypothetical protein